MNPKLSMFFSICILAIVADAAFAADTPTVSAPAAPADPLVAARAQIAAKRFESAIDELKRVNATESADWNNLMGYSQRKAKAPDLAASERYYDAALQIDPKHRGTLEYSGELYLMKGNLPKAEQRLASLEQVCGTRCTEYGELKQAIERYKVSGNKAARDY